MRIRYRLVVGAMATALAFVANTASAQTYPNRPIRIVVPYPPGNASDTVSRMLGEHLVKRLGQQIVVDNRPGASGGIGARTVARATPDGYTLLMTSTSFTINTAITADLMYDVEKDFEPIAMVSSGGGMVLLTRPDFPAKNVRELIDLLKRDPGKYNYAHVGRGTIQHLTMESFLAATGTAATAVAYKGSVQALTDMVTGQIHVMFDPRGSSLAFVESGKVRMMAITSEQRSTMDPEVPTARESGVPGLKEWSVRGWVGLLAPAKTPAAIVQRLNKEVVDALKTPEMVERLRRQRMEPLPALTPEGTREFLLADMRRWQAAAKAAKIEKE